MKSWTRIRFSTPQKLPCHQRSSVPVRVQPSNFALPLYLSRPPMMIPHLSFCHNNLADKQKFQLRPGHQSPIHCTSLYLGWRPQVRECRYLLLTTPVLPVYRSLAWLRLRRYPRTSAVPANCGTQYTDGLHGADSDLFSRLVVDAMMAVKRSNSKGKAKYPVKAVNIIKVHGGSARESRLIKGYALYNTVASEACPKQINGAKIACLVRK